MGLVSSVSLNKLFLRTVKKDPNLRHVLAAIEAFPVLSLLLQYVRLRFQFVVASISILVQLRDVYESPSCKYDVAIRGYLATDGSR